MKLISKNILIASNFINHDINARENPLTRNLFFHILSYIDNDVTYLHKTKFDRKIFFKKSGYTEDDILELYFLSSHISKLSKEYLNSFLLNKIVITYEATLELNNYLMN